MDGAFTLCQDPDIQADVLAALIWAEDLPPSTPGSRELDEAVAGLVARAAREGESLVPQATRDAVRAMLRHGTYKPSGRGKPASEFLLRAAIAGEFPRICGPVDANNVVSLASGLPGSIFDAELTGRDLYLRRGRAGEEYVFNPSGQSIDLEDLLVVCRDVGGRWEPCGNPVKDAMATKIRDATRAVVAVLYVPRPLGKAFADPWAARYAELLERGCGARRVGLTWVGPA